MTTKITKKMYLATIKAIVADAEANSVELPEGVTYEGINGFVDHELELLESKAAAAAERAAKKKVAGDALREKVASVLTDEFQTIPEIVAAIGDVNTTAQMITPRLTQLVDLGQAVKEQKTVAGVDGGKSRKVSSYKRA